MVTLPSTVEGYPLAANGQPLQTELASLGWILMHRGKVRDTYYYPDDQNILLVVASDRLSIFDIVLRVLVAQKGEIVTALTHFWFNTVFNGVAHHLIGVPQDIRLPRERCLLVRRRTVQPYELIFRYHPGGSVWAEYLQNGTMGGVQFPPGLQKWAKLQQAAFTPSTKAQVGHDQNVTAVEYFGATGKTGKQTVQTLLEVYRRAYDFALERGIVILDTKFEADEHGGVVDEVLTLDCSRYTTIEALEEALSLGRDPVFYDKEQVREWGRLVQTPFGVPFSGLDPENPEHLAFVADLTVPDEIVAETSSHYRHLFQSVVGMQLEEYQQTRLFSPE